MKVLSSNEIRLWDQFTIENEPIASIDLMERAAKACVHWIEEYCPPGNRFVVFCGKGNNGGDGLAIARILAARQYQVNVFILEFGHKGTSDFQTNLAGLHEYPEVDIRFIQTEGSFHPLDKTDIVIDALYGSGLNRPLDGVTASLVTHINNSSATIISIDIPSGLFVDHSSKDNPVIKAQYTLAFQCYKPAFLVQDNGQFVGNVQLLDIGLLPEYYAGVRARYEVIDPSLIHSIFQPRPRQAHKGDFGHALLIAGSYGKIGAAILATKACMRSGTGLVTCHVPRCGYDIIQSTVPEAMVLTDFNSSFNTRVEADLTIYDSIGIGPGIGIASETKMMLREVFDSYRSPMVLDADALNIMASQKDLLKMIPAGSILTPHPKEFERLFGETMNDFDRIQLASDKACELNVMIVLKGHHSFIATPDGKGFFNSSGNPGMATGGSGDVLTGMLTGLIAQGYSTVESAILGVYLHGLAGDLAAAEISEEAMIAGDLINYIGKAFLQCKAIQL
jgi:ADP-dependent NAD(P)H-hydrate dehydratase / NAD(P)H-hydrate epimerase